MSKVPKIGINLDHFTFVFQTQLNNIFFIDIEHDWQKREFLSDYSEYIEGIKTWIHY